VDIKYTRFERARIISARAFQISLGAPVLVDAPETMIEPLQLASLEWQKNAIPITVKRPE
jgi:DNA-directed RNA polymerase subunit K